mmetsp:Transcript_66215/g.147196  ORF Transcript_66215/g.147196 Transcript_66215/m.147196 type:complete len:349 (-) Transcript_66215:84-1130(-)
MMEEGDAQLRSCEAAEPRTCQSKAQLTSYILKELEKLTENVDFLVFPASLNAAERKHAHEVVKSQKLASVSMGSGEERKLQVFRPGAKKVRADAHLLIQREEQLSRKLSSLLRHSGEQRGIGMLQDGYAPLSTVLSLREFSRGGYKAEEVEELVEKDAKKRFEITSRAGEMWIRATQGHTIKSVKDEALLQPLGLEEARNLQSCVHGTYMLLWEEILESGGLSRMARNHIHFTTCTTPTDELVSGMRSDCEVVIYISVLSALEAGLQFFRSSNGVILSPGDDRGMVSTKHFVKVACLKDGSILWPTAKDTGPSKATKDQKESPRSEAGGDDDEDEVICFCKPLLHMYI